jgi:hypothetical protein
MNPNRPRPLGELLQSGDIQRLRAEAADRRQLTEKVRSRMPKEEAEHVVGAHFDAEQRLVVAVDSAAWAARIRFLAGGVGRVELRVRVAPAGRSAD